MGFPELVIRCGYLPGKLFRYLNDHFAIHSSNRVFPTETGEILRRQRMLILILCLT